MGCCQSCCPDSDSGSEIPIQSLGQCEEAEFLPQEPEVLRQEAELLRQKARKIAKKMRKMKKKNHHTQARHFNEEMRQYNYEAAIKLLAANNERNGPNLMDVHGLYPDEAQMAVKQRMRKVVELKVITGYGRHSRDGTAKVKPAIENLRDEGYNVKHDPLNPGVLIVSGGSNGHPNATTGRSRWLQ